MKAMRVWTTVLVFLMLTAGNTAASEVFTPAQEARLANFLNMDLYVYETTLVGTAEDLKNTASAHLDYQVMLEKKGIMFGAGPTFTEDSKGHPKAGLIIIRAKSFEAAKAIADADPMHAKGVRTYRLYRWQLNEGRLNLSIRLSDQKFTVK